MTTTNGPSGPQTGTDSPPGGKLTEARLLAAFIRVMATEKTGRLGWDHTPCAAREALLTDTLIHKLEREGADGLWPDSKDETTARELRGISLARENGGLPFGKIIKFRPRK